MRNEGIKRLAAEVKSNVGFYIGDICYVLPDNIYHGIWGDKHGYESGLVEVEAMNEAETEGGGQEPQTPQTAFAFAVASTNFGDGLYGDEEGCEYPVDAGVIGIVPLELVKADIGSDLNLGRVERTPGTARFEAEDGIFDITLPDGRKVHIDTRYYVDEEHAEDQD